MRMQKNLILGAFAFLLSTPLMPCLGMMPVMGQQPGQSQKVQTCVQISKQMSKKAARRQKTRTRETGDAGQVWDVNDAKILSFIGKTGSFLTPLMNFSRSLEGNILFCALFSALAITRYA